MNIIFTLLLTILFADDMNIQTEISKIKTVLTEQKSCWNNGDINGFMQGYWNSEELEFSSENGVTKGWENTLERYLTSYPNTATMGTLQFQLGKVKIQNDSIASLNGKWELIRESDNPKGSFILTFNKIDGQWLIIKDYTTSE